MASIKIIGHKKLDKKLRENLNMDAVKRVVQKNGDQMNEKMTSLARGTLEGGVFAKGYSNGDTASSINTVISDGGMTATVEPTTEYAPYPEFGTRFMEAEPYVRPAFEEQVMQFKKDMDKLTK